MIGWIQVCEVNHLMEDRFAEVIGLVVADKWRNQGVGALLMETAENWARQKASTGVWIRSNVKREKAHNFYKHLGYKEIKKQAVLVKRTSHERKLPIIQFSQAYICCLRCSVILSATIVLSGAVPG